MRDPIEPGIYFGLPYTDYRDDPALGSTDLKEILQCPQNWHWDRYSPFAKEEGRPSPALKFGSAVHAMVLEGEDVFNARFFRKPPIPATALSSLDDLKGHAKSLGLPVSGTKAELIKRIRTKDTAVVIEQEELDKAQNEIGNRVLLSDDEWARVQMAGAMIRNNPALKAAFVGGHPEVSIFWQGKDGVRLKARIDYLKVKAVVDLKSMSNWRGKNFTRSWALSVSDYRYDMQVAHYMNARSVCAELIEQGKVFAYDVPMPSADWLDALAQEQDPQWIWVVYQSQGAPISQGFHFPTAGPAYEAAMIDVGRAIDLYRENVAKFGLDNMWLNVEDIETIVAEDLPQWLYA